MPEFAVTNFFHHSARHKSEVKFETLAQLAEVILDTHAQHKDQLPWLKLARFGQLTTAKGSLRHDANVLTITGLVADYDGGEIFFLDAVMILKRAGVWSLLYTSPSHTRDKPRYRIVCPFSQELPPAEHAPMMARLNGLFDGKLAAESFTLSQSYYFGFLVNEAGEPLNEGQIEVIEGNSTPIDLVPGLAHSAIGKRGKLAVADAGNGHDVGAYTETSELIRRIVSGESLRPSVTTLAGRFAKNGWDRQACKETIGAAMALGSRADYPSRLPQELEAIDWVYGREAAKPQTETKPSEPSQPSQPLPWIWQRALAAWDLEPTPERAWTVPNRIPARQVNLLSGHGSTGKSLVGLHLCVAHVLGRDWLKSMPEFGPAFFIDAEDDINEIHIRLAALIKHFHVSYQELANGGLQILPMGGAECVMGAVLNHKSGLVTATPFYDAVLERAGDVKPQHIVIANSANVFAGSENDRSQVQQFVGLLRRIALVTAGAVTLIAHSSLTGLNTQTGLSGTTQWHNAVRARQWLKSVKPDDSEQQVNDNLRVLEFLKNQYGRIDEQVVLQFNDGILLPATSSELERVQREDRADNVFMELLRLFHGGHRPLSNNELARNYAPTVFGKEEECRRLGLTKRDMIDAMSRAWRKGTIRFRQWGPPSQRVTYVEPNAPPDTPS